MDAAHTLWRPLGTMLVERGLLTVEELEDVLEEQKQSGRRLGEIIVDRGLISGPTLAMTLAEQWGVELTMDEGFGTGLRTEIQRRHEGERQRRPHLRAVTREEKETPSAAADADLIAQIEDREQQLAELSVELAQDDVRLATLESELEQRDARIAQLEEEAREREAAHAAEVDARARHEVRLAGLFADGFKRLEQVFEARTADLDARPSRKELADLISDRITDLEAGSAKNAERFELALRECERRLETSAKERAHIEAEQGKSIAQQIARLQEGVAKLTERPAADDGGFTEQLSEELRRLEASLAEKTKQVERQLVEAEERLASVLAERTDAWPNDYEQHAAELSKVLDDRLGGIEASLAETRKQLERKLASAEQRFAEVLAARRDDPRGAAEVSKVLDERLDRLEASLAESTTSLERKLASAEQRFAQVLARRRDDPRGEAEVSKVLDERVAQLETVLAERAAQIEQTVSAVHTELAELLAEERERMQASALDPAEDGDRFSKLVADEVRRSEKQLLATLTVAKEQIVAAFEERASSDDDAGVGQLRSRFDDLAAGLAAAVDRVDGLEVLVRKTATDILDRLESQSEAVSDAAEEPEPDEHLLFMPHGSGYALVTIACTPPEVGATLTLAGERLVVTKVAASPFPLDERPCAYVQRVD